MNNSMKKIGLITSGAYVSEALAAEFGYIPPCLLPLGNDHLLYHQFLMLSELVDEVFVSLPLCYDLSEFDKIRLDDAGIQILRTDPKLKLGESISNCVKTIGQNHASLCLLFGDTLFTNIFDIPRDFATTHVVHNEYDWADLSAFEQDNSHRLENMTLSGLFCFSAIGDLMSAIDCEQGDFIKALHQYNKINTMKFISDGNWFDFGHVQTYFNSVGSVTTQRSFNSLEMTNKRVRKTSNDKKKINSEASWFINLPDSLKLYTPAFLGRESDEKSASYSLSNTHLSTLSNLAIFGHLKSQTWENIFSGCADFLNECRQIKPNVTNNLSKNDYFTRKTKTRLKTLASSEFGAKLLSCEKVNQLSMPKLDEVISVTGEIIENSNHGSECVTHGDFCFSNIFYDFRSALIQVIDPRGLLPDGTTSLYGLQTYDIAKLGHSVIGGYDAIMSNYLQSKLEDNNIRFETGFLYSKRWQNVSNAFKESAIYLKHEKPFTYAMIINLFLSMIPLHSDRPDRQVSMYARAMQLYKEELS